MAIAEQVAVEMLERPLGQGAVPQVEIAASMTGVVAGAMLQVSRATPVGRNASARPGAAGPVDAGTGKRARVLLRLLAHVIGRRGDPAIMRCGSDASSTRNEAPSAAAVERVLWARRHQETPPRCASAAVSVVTPATRRLSMPQWSWSLGQTLPYRAVSSPTPGTHGRDDLG